MLKLSCRKHSTKSRQSVENQKGQARRLHWLIAFAPVTLGACGGGGGGNDGVTPTSPVAIPAGVYDVSFQGLNEAGTLLKPATGLSTYTTKAFIGFVALDPSGNAVGGQLRLLDRPIDDLNNEFPSAKDSSVARELTLTSGSSGAWSGSGAVITPRTISTQPIAAIPHLWRFRNLYRFAGSFLDYEMQIDLNSAGDLTGFDTNGCQFTGQLTRTESEPTYAIRIIATNCGATTLYIENGEYIGRAYVASSAPDQRLIAVAVNESLRLGLSLELVPR